MAAAFKTAAELRAITDTAAFNGITTDVLQGISAAAQAGDYHTTIVAAPYPRLMTVLRAKGYNVSHNDNVWSVNWAAH